MKRWFFGEILLNFETTYTLKGLQQLLLFSCREIL